MTKQEYDNLFANIINNGHMFGVEIFAALKKPEVIKRFVVTDELKDSITSKIKGLIMNGFMASEKSLEDAALLAQNKDCFYEIKLSKNYNPFEMLYNWNEIVEQYSEKDIERLTGFWFRINFNDKAFWVYQHIYPMALIQKSKNIYAVIGKNKVHDLLKSDIVSMASRIDLYVIGDRVVTANIKLMQSKFGYDRYIRSEAQSTIDYIIKQELVSNPEILSSFSDKEKLTNAKKLMMAKNSPVLGIERTVLTDRIGRHARYCNLIKIEDGKIVTKTEKDVNAFLKLLNDDYVKSELTEAEYDSTAKKMLDPV